MSSHNNNDNTIIIHGITEKGEQFRPSDWAERTCGSLSTFRNHKIIYSPLLRPGIKNNYKCVLIDPTLKTSNPKLYQQLIKFAEDNHLQMCRASDLKADPPHE